MTRALLLTFSLSILVLATVLALPGQARSQGSKATITGVVSFSGKAPVAKAIDSSSDPICAAKKQRSEEVIVSEGKLKDVHVRIKSGSAGRHKPPSSPVVISQDGCVYSPHMIGAMVGQKVAIKNKDKTMHNVHAVIGTETWFNRSQPKGAPDIVESDTGEAGEVFELKCNVHPWMHSYLPITDHPYFDVSATDGSFKIKNVPPGSYTLEAWHPKYGLKSTKISVASAEVKANFQFP